MCKEVAFVHELWISVPCWIQPLPLRYVIPWRLSWITWSDADDCAFPINDTWVCLSVRFLSMLLRFLMIFLTNSIQYFLGSGMHMGYAGFIDMACTALTMSALCLHKASSLVFKAQSWSSAWLSEAWCSFQAHNLRIIPGCPSLSFYSPHFWVLQKQHHVAILQWFWLVKPRLKRKDKQLAKEKITPL